MKKINLFILASLLSGCSLLGSEEPLPLYALESGTFQPTLDLTAPLAIDIPLSEASLNTSRIALTPSPYRRDYLADGEWPDRLPKVFQEVLLQGFAQKWGAAHVNRLSSGLQAKYVLNSEIQDFSVHHLDTARPEIHLKVTLKLIDLRERTVVAAKTFSETTAIPSTTMQGIVGAFNQDLHCLLEKASLWAETYLGNFKSP